MVSTPTFTRFIWHVIVVSALMVITTLFLLVIIG